MVTEKDQQFLEFLIKGTAEGQIRWEPTASENQYTTALKGKYTVTVDKAGNSCWLKMWNERLQEMMFVTSDEDYRVEQIFEYARRGALDVDSAIDEIIGGR